MLPQPASWVHYWLQAIPLYPYYWLYYNSSWFHPQETQLNTAQHISTHLNTSQHISTHLNTSQPHLHQFFQRIHHLARTRRVPLQWRHFITRAWSTLGRSDGSNGSVLRQGVAPKKKNIWSREMPKIWGLKWIELGFNNMRNSSKKELIRIICEIYGLYKLIFNSQLQLEYGTPYWLPKLCIVWSGVWTIHNQWLEPSRRWLSWIVSADFGALMHDPFWTKPHFPSRFLKIVDLAIHRKQPKSFSYSASI